jgi:hypothetical protein
MLPLYFPQCSQISSTHGDTLVQVLVVPEPGRNDYLAHSSIRSTTGRNDYLPVVSVSSPLCGLNFLFQKSKSRLV